MGQPCGSNLTSGSKPSSCARPLGCGGPPAASGARAVSPWRPRRRYQQAGARVARTAPSAPGRLPRAPSGRRGAARARGLATRAQLGAQHVAASAPRPPGLTRAAAAASVAAAPSSNEQGRSQRRAAVRPTPAAWRATSSPASLVGEKDGGEGKQRKNLRTPLELLLQNRSVAGSWTHSACFSCTRSAESTRACTGSRLGRPAFRRTLEHW